MLNNQQKEIQQKQQRENQHILKSHAKVKGLIKKYLTESFPTAEIRVKAPDTNVVVYLTLDEEVALSTRKIAEQAMVSILRTPAVWMNRFKDPVNKLYIHYKFQNYEENKIIKVEVA
jgi:hypothetical protein